MRNHSHGADHISRYSEILDYHNVDSSASGDLDHGAVTGATA
jgi:hypothetical protein